MRTQTTFNNVQQAPKLGHLITCMESLDQTTEARCSIVYKAQPFGEIITDSIRSNMIDCTAFVIGVMCREVPATAHVILTRES